MDAKAKRPSGFISLAVRVLGAIAVTAGPVAAAGPAGVEPRLAGGAVELLLPQGDDYQPAKVRFTVAAATLSVTIDKVEFLDGRRAESSDYAARPKGAPRQAVSTATIKGLGRRALWSSLSKDRPEVVFLVAGLKGDHGRLVLHLGGVDRIVGGQGGSYWARAVRPGAEAVELAGRRLVCQSRSDQHGVVISATGLPAGGTIRIVPTQTGAAVHVPWRSAKSGLAPAIRVVALGVRGDATIALEGEAGGARPAAAPGLEVAVGGKGDTGAAPVGGQAPKPQKTEPSGWEFWTGTDRAFKPLLADPREASVRAGLMYGRHAQKLLDATIGGDLVVAERRFSHDERLTLSMRGLFAARLNTCESSFPLLNSDYFGGVAAGYRTGDDAFELYLFHQSAHLGDEIVERGDRRRIDYSRESVRLLWSHRFGPLRVYGGPTFNLRAWPSEIRGKVTLQAGSEFRFSALGRPMYVAADVQSRQASGWDLNFTGQYGIELGDPKKLKSLPRVFLEVFHGFSNMGQYFDDRETYVMLGFGYNF